MQISAGSVLVNSYGVMNNKDSLYKKALEHLTGLYSNQPVAAQVWYLLARWHADKAAGYDPLKDTRLQV